MSVSGALQSVSRYAVMELRRQKYEDTIVLGGAKESYISVERKEGGPRLPFMNPDAPGRILVVTLQPIGPAPKTPIESIVTETEIYPDGMVIPGGPMTCGGEFDYDRINPLTDLFLEEARATRRSKRAGLSQVPIHEGVLHLHSAGLRAGPPPVDLYQSFAPEDFDLWVALPGETIIRASYALEDA